MLVTLVQWLIFTQNFTIPHSLVLVLILKIFYNPCQTSSNTTSSPHCLISFFLSFHCLPYTPTSFAPPSLSSRCISFFASPIRISPNRFSFHLVEFFQLYIYIYVCTMPYLPAVSTLLSVRHISPPRYLDRDSIPIVSLHSFSWKFSYFSFASSFISRLLPGVPCFSSVSDGSAHVHRQRFFVIFEKFQVPISRVLQFFREINFLAPQSIQELTMIINDRNVFKFLAVRHPFERIVSSYR